MLKLKVITRLMFTISLTKIKEKAQFYIKKMFSRNMLIPTSLMWVNTLDEDEGTSTWDLGDFCKEVTAGACLEMQFFLYSY